MRSILRSRCSWWCSGRFWALHHHVHPVYSSVITILQRTTWWNLQWNGFVEFNLQNALSEIGLQFVRREEGRGILFRRRPRECDCRVIDVFKDKIFRWSSDAEFPHLLRTVCRDRALMSASSKRLDYEGMGNVDIEACSRKPLQQIRDSLTPEQSADLTIFRCGAASTPTRKEEGRNYQGPPRCESCGAAVWPSMRHLVVECSKFDLERNTISDELTLPEHWWSSLPRVSSKSGWITFAADDNPNRRSVMQVALARMGLRVLKFTKALLDEKPRDGAIGA